MLVFPVILAVMGLGFLVAGWQGFRMAPDPDVLALLSETEIRRRRIMVRGGSYACLLSGATLVVTSAVVAYDVLALLR